MQIVIGTAGHIDHGKTSLVKSLTGTDTDHLLEEKNRGMTIDLGFAYFNKEITIIDVPGHEKFIRNMVAGVSTIQIALIVVAADDGLMPQTYEHIDILHFLNVQHAIIALSKIDTVEENWIEMVEKDIKTAIEQTNFKNANIIRTSTKTGNGIDLLKEEIAMLCKNVKTDHDRGFFYLPVDRVFSKTGHGTVVTGTVISGKAEISNELEVMPEGKKVTVRSMQTHGEITPLVQMGDRAAINLSNIDKNTIRRGSTLVAKNLIKPTSKIIAHIKMANNTKWKIKNKQSVHVHIGTCQVVAKAITYGLTLSSGQSANILLELNKPISSINDQRFIIRSFSPMETIAGCVILDQNPKVSKKELRLLIQTLDLDPSKRINQLIDINWKNPLSLKEWSGVFNTNLSQINNWIHGQEIMNDCNLLFNTIILDRSKNQILDEINKFHLKHPYKKSIPREELINMVGYSKEWFDYTINELTDEVSVINAGYALKNNKMTLEGADIEIANTIESKIKNSKFNLLSSSDLENKNPDKALQILHILKDKEKIIQIASDLWIHEDYHKKLVIQLTSFFKTNSQLSISDFKSLTLTTRKNAIPLLEFCDKNELTIREDNCRVKGKAINV